MEVEATSAIGSGSDITKRDLSNTAARSDRRRRRASQLQQKLLLLVWLEAERVKGREVEEGLVAAAAAVCCCWPAAAPLRKGHTRRWQQQSE